VSALVTLPPFAGRNSGVRRAGEVDRSEARAGEGKSTHCRHVAPAHAHTSSMPSDSLRGRVKEAIRVSSRPLDDDQLAARASNCRPCTV
jgi:hypothetical protein